jgi:hypothetical protein
LQNLITVITLSSVTYAEIIRFPIEVAPVICPECPGGCRSGCVWPPA